MCDRVLARADADIRYALQSVDASAGRVARYVLCKYYSMDPHFRILQHAPTPSLFYQTAHVSSPSYHRDDAI
jgi:hypothetical protein